MNPRIGSATYANHAAGHVSLARVAAENQARRLTLWRVWEAHKAGDTAAVSRAFARHDQELAKARTEQER